MRRASSDVRPRVYRLKVVLLEVRPPIWRRFLIRDDRSLATLHRNLQTIVGWSGSHGHEFSTKTRFFGPPDLADICPCGDERRTMIREVLRFPKDRIAYDYDYGDGWCHDVMLEGIETFHHRARYPWVLTGRRACPPEDVGGVMGYAAFMDAMRNPARFGSKALRRWHGGPYDPERFDPDEVNRKLHPRLVPPIGELMRTRSVRRDPETQRE
jgi:hypothetical protein